MFKHTSLPLLAASALLSSAAWAATPASGVLTEEGKDTEVTWEGDGPYVFTNVTPALNGVSEGAVPLLCEPAVAQTCDLFTLEVNIPEEFRMDEANRRETVRVGIEFPFEIGNSTAGEDYDLYMYDSSGALIGTAAGEPGLQEVLTFPLQSLKNGTYTVQVIPFTPLGTNYTGYARIGQRPSATAAALSIAPQAGSAPLAVTLDARSLSKAPVSSYVVDFGDGSAPVTSTSGVVQHTYTRNGQYLARVTMTTNGTKTVASAAQPVFVGELPVVSKSGSLFGGAFGLAALMGLAGFGLLRLRRRA